MSRENKPSSFPFYPYEWLSSPSIMLMTPAEEGAYIRLLALAWNDIDCGLTDNENDLAILSRLGEQWFNGSGEKILSNFFKKDGRIFNKKLLEERKKQKICKEKNIRNGKKGAKKRWGREFPGDSQAIARLFLNDSPAIARPFLNARSSLNNKKTTKNRLETIFYKDKTRQIEQQLNNNYFVHRSNKLNTRGICLSTPEKTKKQKTKSLGITITEGNRLNTIGIQLSKLSSNYTILSTNSKNKNEVDEQEKNNGDEQEKFYVTKKKKKLTGDSLKWFEQFWEAFNYKIGKADAADSWLNIKPLTLEIAEYICNKARAEASRRNNLVKNGRIPKMAQGWLSSRRWEDEESYKKAETLDEWAEREDK